MNLPILLLALFASLITAHFTLTYPPGRGDNKRLQGQFPCGGLSQSTERTNISLASPTFPISVNLGHHETAMQFLLAVGPDPGTNHNITLSDTFRVEGAGKFCLPDNLISEEILGRSLEDGLDLTLQVQTNGHPTGGLYACADLKFTSELIPLPPQSICKNSTGVTAIPFTGLAAHRNANTSTADGHEQGAEGMDHEHGHEHGHEHEYHHGGFNTTNTADPGPEPTSSTGEATRAAAWEVMSLAVGGGLVMLFPDFLNFRL
ncbi:hypothetical protein BDV06DRAFT_227145 [Aspergillus oleicola]